jgi:hypothetical protein
MFVRRALRELAVQHGRQKRVRVERHRGPARLRRGVRLDDDVGDDAHRHHGGLARLPPVRVTLCARRFALRQPALRRGRQSRKRRLLEAVAQLVQEHPAHSAHGGDVVVLVGDVLVGVIAPRLLLRARHAHVPDRLIHHVVQRGGERRA